MKKSSHVRFCACLLVWAGLAIADGHDEPVEVRLAAFMQQAADEGFTGGVVVARGDDLLLRAVYGKRVPGTDDPVQLDTISTIGSITKQFTAAAVMLLEQQKKLSVDDTLGEWFDDVPAEKAEITIHQLLSHQAGFAPALGPDNERIGRQAYLNEAFASELLFRPGDGYEYSNVGYSIAAAIVELASGENYESILKKNFFEPLAMHDTGYRLPDDVRSRIAHGRKDDGSDWGSVYENFLADGGPGWHLVGNGGIHSTLDDMLRWHRGLQDGQILNEASTARLYGKYAPEPGGTFYGYGWSIEETPWGATLITHNGGNRYYFADFLRFPDDDVAIYLWTTSREGRLKDIGRPLASIVYGNETPSIRPPPPALLPVGSGPVAAKDSYAARWQLPGSPQAEVAAQMLELVLTDDEPLRDALIDETIHPALLEKRGAAAIVDLAAAVRNELGDYRLVGIRPYPDNRVDIEFDTVQGILALELGLDDDDGLKVRGIGLRVGD
ncbi:MAG: beta-lactamase family protein [Woeseia sp.]|nr:beta-lactamase family protein [Woeseia sp.]